MLRTMLLRECVEGLVVGCSGHRTEGRAGVSGAESLLTTEKGRTVAPTAVAVAGPTTVVTAPSTAVAPQSGQVVARRKLLRGRTKTDVIHERESQSEQKTEDKEVETRRDEGKMVVQDQGKGAWWLALSRSLLSARFKIRC